MRRLLLIFFIFQAEISFGSSFSEKLSEKFRPYFKKFLGKKRTDKILGAKKSGITLPLIPEIKKDARSVELLKRKKRKGQIKKLSATQKQRYDLVFIREVSKVTRHLKSKSDEDRRWLNVMSQGGTREGVYRGIVLDERYKKLEVRSHPVSAKVAKFSVYYANNFLAQDIGLGAISASNFYTLKKNLF